LAKKVLYIELGSDINAGGDRSLLQLLKHLDRTAFSPYVICAGSGTLAEKLIEIDVHVDIIQIKPLRGLKILYRLPWSVWKIFWFIKREGIERVHITAPRVVLISGLAARLANIPVIWHVRIASSDKVYDRINLWLSDRIIVISKAVQKRFEWYRGSKKIHLIHNGVDPEEFCPRDISHPFREQLNLEQTFITGILGQILPEKGHGEFIEAARRVHSELPHVHFLIVGKDNPYKRELQRQVEEMRLAETIHFVDFSTDVVALINTLDLVVVPSYHEAFGRVTIEAMACAKPVIATYTGAGREIITDGEDGVLIPPWDAEALKSAIKDLILDEKKRERIAKQGREKVIRSFHIRDHVRKIEEVY
jgi:glycosyltransferase involved in cell wall biosynthesis